MVHVNVVQFWLHRELWTRWVADWTDLRSTVAMMPQLCLLLALIMDISRVHAGYLDTVLDHARVITVSSPNMTGPFSMHPGWPSRKLQALRRTEAKRAHIRMRSG